MKAENFTKAIHKFSHLTPHIENQFFRCDVHLSRIMITTVPKKHILHKHIYYELHIPIWSSAQYLVEDDICTCTPQQALLISPDHPHQHLSSENYAAITFGFTFTTPGTPSLGSAYTHIPISDDIHNAIIYILHTLQDESRDNYYIFNSLYSTIFHDLLMCVLPFRAYVQSISTTPDAKNISNTARIRQAVQYIQDNLSFPISAEDVAIHLNLSSRQLNRILKQELGRSINQLMNDLRIQAAKEQISSTHLSLSAIAAQCGFNSPTHFNLTFKKITGITPKLYRQQSHK